MVILLLLNAVLGVLEVFVKNYCMTCRGSVTVISTSFTILRVTAVPAGIAESAY